MKRLPSSYGFSSHAIHAGEQDNEVYHAHVAPIYQTSTFGFSNVDHGKKIFGGQEKGYIYSRWGNPSVEIVENKIAALEGMELRDTAQNGDETTVSALAFSSGMAAISTLLFTHLRPGDTVITHGCLYGGTTELIENLLKEMDIHHEITHMDTPDKIEAAISRAKNPKLVYVETPANPTLEMCDIALAAEVAHNHGLKLVVDNTFATPILQQPLALGADYAVHSTTKYLNGHGTSVGGVVVSRDGDFIKQHLWEHAKLMGGSLSPFDAWLINQGLKTLEIRIQRHCANARQVAEWLEDHPRVASVAYPGLEHFQYYSLAKKQMKDSGGMISFELKGGLEEGVQLMNGVRLCTLAVSLGTVDTLIQHPASMTHAGVPREERLEFGITDGLVRLSVGLENAEDIIDDLDRALNQIDHKAA